MAADVHERTTPGEEKLVLFRIDRTIRESCSDEAVNFCKWPMPSEHFVIIHPVAQATDFVGVDLAVGCDSSEHALENLHFFSHEIVEAVASEQVNVIYYF